MKLRLKLFDANRLNSGRLKRANKTSFKEGDLMGQNAMLGRWRGAVRPGEVLNPRGCKGKKHRSKIKTPGSRDRSMAKKRERIEAKRALALEARELQELARVNARAAMKALIDIFNSKQAPEPSRIAAAQVILDRGYGKAAQTTFNASINTDGKATEIGDNELEQRIATALKRVEDITRGAAKAPARPKQPIDLRKCN